jgi:hypothetical protein
MRTDRHRETSSSFSQFYESALKQSDITPTARTRIDTMLQTSGTGNESAALAALHLPPPTHFFVEFCETLRT